MSYKKRTFVVISLLIVLTFFSTIIRKTDIQKLDILPFFANIKNIFLINNNALSKKNVFFNYLKLEANRLVGTTSKLKIQLFGLNIDYVSSQSLRSLFSEIFINNDYFIDCKKENPFIIDLCGNIGMTTMYYKILYPESNILVFEPSPYLFSKLTKNIKNNSMKNVEAINKAAFSSEGTFSFTDNSNLNGCINEKKSTNTNVNATILSKYINQDVDILKIDIEGAELHVLKELNNTKKIHYVKNILLEYHHNDFDNNKKLLELLNIFNENNFSYKIKSAHINDPYMTIIASKKT